MCALRCGLAGPGPSQRHLAFPSPWLQAAGGRPARIRAWASPLATAAAPPLSWGTCTWASWRQRDGEDESRGARITWASPPGNVLDTWCIFPAAFLKGLLMVTAPSPGCGRIVSAAWPCWLPAQYALPEFASIPFDSAGGTRPWSLNQGTGRLSLKRLYWGLHCGGRTQFSFFPPKFLCFSSNQTDLRQINRRNDHIHCICTYRDSVRIRDPRCTR